MRHFDEASTGPARGGTANLFNHRGDVRPNRREGHSIFRRRGHGQHDLRHSAAETEVRLSALVNHVLAWRMGALTCPYN